MIDLNWLIDHNIDVQINMVRKCALRMKLQETYQVSIFRLNFPFKFPCKDSYSPFSFSMHIFFNQMENI